MKTTIVINQDCMGHGDKVLGKKIIGAFFKKIWAREDKPTHIVLYNSGVNLLTKKGEVLDALTGLSDSGVEILGCGTCIDAYGISDDIMVGTVSNMEDIVSAMEAADKVITL